MSMQRSLFLAYHELVTPLFSTYITVNLLLPHPVFGEQQLMPTTPKILSPLSFKGGNAKTNVLSSSLGEGQTTYVPSSEKAGQLSLKKTSRMFTGRDDRTFSDKKIRSQEREPDM